MPVELRTAERDDIAALLELVREHAAFERSPAPLITANVLSEALFAPSPRLHAWTASVDGALAGYLTATVDFSTWQGREFLSMDCLYVRAAHRSVGIGAQFVNVLRRHAQANGIAEIQWQTPDWNVDAARFYRRLGAGEMAKRRFSLAVGPGLP